MWEQGVLQTATNWAKPNCTASLSCLVPRSAGPLPLLTLAPSITLVLVHRSMLADPEKWLLNTPIYDKFVFAHNFTELQARCVRGCGCQHVHRRLPQVHACLQGSCAAADSLQGGVTLPHLALSMHSQSCSSSHLGPLHLPCDNYVAPVMLVCAIISGMRRTLFSLSTLKVRTTLPHLCLPATSARMSPRSSLGAGWLVTLWTNKTGQPPRCGSQVGMGSWGKGLRGEAAG